MGSSVERKKEVDEQFQLQLMDGWEYNTQEAGDSSYSQPLLQEYSHYEQDACGTGAGAGGCHR